MSMNVSAVGKWFQHIDVNKGKMLEFNPGDVVKGKVMKLFPNQTALVQMNGSPPLVAQLQAPLTAHTSYWFEVQSKADGKLQLKVLNNGLQGMPEQGEAIEPLLKELNVPLTKTNMKLITSLMEKNLPLPKNNLPSIADWLSSKANTDIDIYTIEQMIKSKLPLTKETFLSARSLYDGSSFTQQLQMLSSLLEESGAAATDEAQLKELIHRLLSHIQPGSGHDGKELAKAFKFIFQSLGLQYEQDLKQYLKTDNASSAKADFQTLKALLLQYEQHAGAERSLAEQLIHKVTGYQLLSREDGPLTSLYMQLPVLLGDKPQDVTIQWEGRQKGDGTIDPNYCRILFCLQLEHLKETIVDVTVQNRVVSIGVINDHDLLSMLVKKMEPMLKDKLGALHYHLSDVKVITSSAEQGGPSLFSARAAAYRQNSPYAGVDVKI